MLELKKGVDILAEVGGIESIDEAKKLFQEKLDEEHLARLAKIKNEEALLKIANAIACASRTASSSPPARPRTWRTSAR